MFDDLESVIGYQEATDFTYMVEDFKSLHGFAMFQPMCKSLLKMKTKNPTNYRIGIKDKIIKILSLSCKLFSCLESKIQQNSMKLRECIVNIIQCSLYKK